MNTSLPPRDRIASGIAKGVGLTAIVVAQARAAESRRADRLFDDWLAEHFVVGARRSSSDQLATAPNAGVFPFMGDYFAIRTRFFDEQVLDACAAGCRQVVLLGAGLDTRAFRLSWPGGTRLFELDTPELFRFKEDVLREHARSPACQRLVVPVDLSEGWAEALVAAGFRRDAPTMWVAEGILIYLTERESEELLDQVGKHSAPRSRIALSRTGPAAFGSAPSRPTSKAIGNSAGFPMASLWKSGTSKIDLRQLLASRGWQVSRHDIFDLADRYGRPPPPALQRSDTEGTAAGFVSGRMGDAT